MDFPDEFTKKTNRCAGFDRLFHSAVFRKMFSHRGLKTRFEHSHSSPQSLPITIVGCCSKFFLVHSATPQARKSPFCCLILSSELLPEPRRVQQQCCPSNPVDPRKTVWTFFVARMIFVKRDTFSVTGHSMKDFTVSVLLSEVKCFQGYLILKWDEKK